jgi:uncharacterized hydantoinase/oxoprolinase family protein
MVCADLEMLADGDITVIAERVARAQVRQIAGGMRRVMRRLGSVCPSLAVLAGQGTFIAQAAAQEVGLASRELAMDLGPGAARAAPAAAVAYLLAASAGDLEAGKDESLECAT